MLHRRGAAVGALMVAAGCNAIAGVDDYVNVACAKDCGADARLDGAESDAALDDGAVEADATSQDGGTDALPALAACPNGSEGRIELTVTGNAATVVSNPPGLNVATNSTASACFLLTNSIDLRTSGPTADWTGAICENGASSSDRCRVTPLTNGLRVTATVK